MVTIGAGGGYANSWYEHAGNGGQTIIRVNRLSYVADGGEGADRWSFGYSPATFLITDGLFSDNTTPYGGQGTTTYYNYGAGGRGRSYWYWYYDNPYKGPYSGNQGAVIIRYPVAP